MEGLGTERFAGGAGTERLGDGRAGTVRAGGAGDALGRLEGDGLLECGSGAFGSRFGGGPNCVRSAWRSGSRALSL